MSPLDAIWAFLYKFIKDLKHQRWQDIPSNLTINQIQALKQLQRQMDIINKPSDKGGNIVLMSHAQYQAMCYDVLKNHTWYKPISTTAVQSFIGEFQGLCTGAFWQGLIDQDKLDYLTTKFPRVPTLPKTHKDLRSPPGRPVVSGIGSIMKNASKFVVAFLMPHIQGLPS